MWLAGFEGERDMRRTRAIVLLVGAVCFPGTTRAQEIQPRPLTEELRIGTAAGGSTSFGTIGAFAVGPSGKVWVYDGLDHAIRVFSDDGAYVRTVGRSGAGPGEFKAVIGMAWSPSDELWVVDAGNGRYSVFDSAGVLVGDFRRPVQTYDARWTGGFDRQGRFFDQAYLPATRNRLPQALLHVLEDRAVDTVVLPNYVSQGARLGSMWLPLPFARQLVMTFDPDGFVWYGVSDRYRITRRALDTGVEVAFDGSERPRQLSGGERDSVSRYLRRLQTDFKVAYRDADRPSVHPLFDDLFLCPERREVWVRRADQPQGSVFDVFDYGGQLAARLVTPVTVVPSPSPVCRGDRLWAVVRGEMDVPYLVRLRVP